MHLCKIPVSYSRHSLQASLRNLVLDITPGEQLATANAWHGRFNHVGNIVGFTMGTSVSSTPNQLRLSEYTLAGFLNLGHVPIIRLVGGGQFRKGTPRPTFPHITFLHQMIADVVSSVCRGVDTVGAYRMDHVLDSRGKGKGQYFW